MRIQTLPSELINQIAAGEVIERPASVVKELMENSLDAKASCISVRVKSGGLGLIEVEDNGHGIHRDDLPLALISHATSKLSILGELPSIQTLGFRGEALASIAAIAKVTLASRFEGLPEAHEVVSYEGQQRVQRANVSVGTTIKVEDLFYCTPVRKRFLKSEKTEWLHIEQAFKRIALSAFHGRFSLMSEHRRMVLPKADEPLQQEKRLEKLLGRSFLQQACPVHHVATNMTLSGWVTKWQAQRRSGDWQYFYINGRYVRDQFVQHAIRQAYHEFSEEGQPGYVLFLQMQPEELDVNVHPMKTQVRFTETRAIHDFLYVSLRQAWQQSKTMPFKSSQESPTWEHKAQNFVDVPKASIHHRSCLTNTQVVALLHQRYALIQAGDDVYCLDIPRAEGRRLQATWQKALATQRIAVRPVLIPTVMSLASEQAAWLLDRRDLWQALGFDMALLSDTQMVVRQVPDCLVDFDITTYVRDCCQMRMTTLAKWCDHLVQYVARHGHWDRSDVLALFQQIDGLTFPFTEEDKAELLKPLSVSLLASLW